MIGSLILCFFLLYIFYIFFIVDILLKREAKISKNFGLTTAILLVINRRIIGLT